MMGARDYRPLVRRRAPYPPSRGVSRAPRLRSLPRLKGALLLSTPDGELHVSANIPKSEHTRVVDAFARHAASGFGHDITLDGEPFTESSLPTELGVIRLVTSVESAATYAYYDWEETP